MKNFSKTLRLTSVASAAVLCATTLFSGMANAYEKGDILVRMGAGLVQSKEDSSNVRGILGVIPNSEVKVDDDIQPAIAVTYMLSNQFGIELLAATPFTHRITTEGLGALGITDVGVTDHLPPTLSVHYYFPGSDTVQPYIGAGYNYTLFTGDKLSSDVRNTLAILGLPDTDLKLKNSHGGSLQLGVDIALNDDWFVNAAIWRMDIDTEAGIYSLGERILEVDVDIDPVVAMVGFGKKF